MKTHCKQRGFALLTSLFIVLTLLGALSMYLSSYLSKQRIKANANSFYNRVLYLQDQVTAYAGDRVQQGWGINTSSIFPSNLGQLEGNYIPNCSTADNLEGNCSRYDQTPWGKMAASDYRVVPVPNAASPTHYRAELSFSIPDDTNKALLSERNTTLQLFAQLPNVVLDDAANKLTVRIERPGKAFAYDALVKRSGDDSTLFGDWDVGGSYAITNVRDLTIRNSDNSQKRVVDKLAEIYTVGHGNWLRKPKCPSGMTLKTNLAVAAVNPAKGYSITGSNRPYKIKENATHMQIGLDILAVRASDGRNVALHSGYVTVFFQCK